MLAQRATQPPTTSQSSAHRTANHPPTATTNHTHVRTRMPWHRYNTGVIPSTKSLHLVDKLAASAFCRRRLPVVMFRVKMAQTIKEAVKFVEQGHIRVG